MMKNNNVKKGNTAKKLLPAAGMLALSASMLATSTYAWFTMSREVEVKNISMTATTPEDVQISLGNLTGATKGYTDNTGFLTPAGEGATADDNGVKAPSAGNNPKDMLDWSNAVDVSNYYALGRIIPASSVSGENIFFTPDSSGVGQTIKEKAEFYTAASGKTAQKEDRTGADTNYKTTLHAFTNAEDKGDSGWLKKASGGYTASSAWNQTNDDGYYVDIPVWFRTSAKDGTKLSVDAYVVPKTTTLDDTTAVNELYKAMRVSIIPDADATTNETGTKTLLPVKDGFDATNKSTKTDPWAASNESIVDFYGRVVSTGGIDADTGKDAVESVTNKVPTYADATDYTPNNCVVDLTGDDNKGTGTGYGAARKYYVRVWLEGEDPECWNANAGQDFNVMLKFDKIDG